VVVSLFIGIHWLRSRGLRRTVELVTLALGACGALVVPFYCWSPREFVFGVLRWHNDNQLFGLFEWRWAKSWSHEIGFGGLFWQLGWVPALKPIQALWVTFVAARYLRAGATARDLGPHVALALILFMIFNPIEWGYLYWPAALVLLVHLAASKLLPLPPPP
jgi:hypothetical protein